MPSESSRSATISWPTRTREDILATIREALPKLRDALPAVRVVLFGSHATGRATVASDVDLLVVYEGPSRAEAFAAVKKTIPIRGLEPHVYTVEEAAKQQDLLGRMTRDGNVIWDRDA
jgi:predicted nucleotidyltransferase